MGGLTDRVAPSGDSPMESVILPESGACPTHCRPCDVAAMASRAARGCSHAGRARSRWAGFASVWHADGLWIRRVLTSGSLLSVLLSVDVRSSPTAVGSDPGRSRGLSRENQTERRDHCLSRFPWKACIRQKRIGGSNPPNPFAPSALREVRRGVAFPGKTGLVAARRTRGLLARSWSGACGCSSRRSEPVVLGGPRTFRRGDADLVAGHCFTPHVARHARTGVVGTP
jgi:hypothetical protein